MLSIILWTIGVVAFIVMVYNTWALGRTYMAVIQSIQEEKKNARQRRTD